MAVTTVNIHGKAYQIKTSDGQEGHVQKLAHMLNQKMFAVAEHLPKVDREYLLILASIMGFDEILENKSIPDEVQEELEGYKLELTNAQNHIEALKLELEQFSKESIEAEKEKAVKAAQKSFEDEQKLNFETQRKQYEKQIAELQMQIVENHDNLSQSREFEDSLEKMLKKQEQELMEKFNTQMSEMSEAYEKELDACKAKALQASKPEEKGGLYIDPAVDLLKTVANKLEK